MGPDREALRQEIANLGLTNLPCLLDAKQAVAQAFDVDRTAEAIVIDSKSWSILYRGALDDQLTEGAERPAPTVKYVELALKAFLAGETIPNPRTPVHGCLLTFGPDEPVNYAKQVAPILQAHCVDCHRAGDIGPFAFSSYQIAQRKARM